MNEHRILYNIRSRNEHDMMLLLTACGDKRGENVLSTLYCNGDLDATKIADDVHCDGVLGIDDCDDDDTSTPILCWVSLCVSTS